MTGPWDPNQGPPVGPPPTPPQPPPDPTFQDYLDIMARWGFNVTTDPDNRGAAWQAFRSGVSLEDWFKQLQSQYGRPIYPLGGPPGAGAGGGGGGGGVGPGQAYIDAAKGYGRDLNAAQASFLVKQGVSLAEWTDRLEQARWLDENQKWLPAFEDTLRARGLLGANQTVNPYDFIKGALPQRWYNVWQEAAGRISAGIAGFDLGGTGNLGLERSDVLAVNAALPGTQTLAQLMPIYQQAAAFALQNGTWENMKGYGLRQLDYVNIAAGIASADTQAKLQRVIQEQDAFAAFRPQLSLAGVTSRQGLVG